MLEEPAIAEEIGARFDHILVDEYQDTNRLQASILLALRPDGRGLVVVGDDAQSIYSFRAATVRNILDFPKAFSPPATVVTLARNYRSTQAILAASNAVIALVARTLCQGAVVGARLGRQAGAGGGRRRSRPGALCGGAGARQPRGAAWR